MQALTAEIVDVIKITVKPWYTSGTERSSYWAFKTLVFSSHSTDNLTMAVVNMAETSGVLPSEINRPWPNSLDSCHCYSLVPVYHYQRLYSTVLVKPVRCFVLLLRKWELQLKWLAECPNNNLQVPLSECAQIFEVETSSNVTADVVTSAETSPSWVQWFAHTVYKVVQSGIDLLESAGTTRLWNCMYLNKSNNFQ